MSSSPQISVILPTFNERDNIGPLIADVQATLAGVAHEILVMDDRSPDGTAQAAREAAGDDGRIRVIEREPPPGLTRSLVDGVQQARGAFVCWFDCDFSHPPALLPELLAPLSAGTADVTCASRYVAGGADARDSAMARRMSFVITRLAKWAIDRRVEDYTTGYVMAPRALVIELGLHGDYGEYCIRLIADALRTGRRVAEIPYRSVPRVHGTSKTATSFAGFVRRGWRYLWTIAGAALRRRG
jgi:dolichol-phosphate mannosyltransferase